MNQSQAKIQRDKSEETDTGKAMSKKVDEKSYLYLFIHSVDARAFPLWVIGSWCLSSAVTVQQAGTTYRS